MKRRHGDTNVKTPISRGCLLLLFLVAIFPGASLAATWTVSTTADSGPGSLRAVVSTALSGDTIEFSISGTISLSSGEIVIDKALSLVGPGSGLLVIDAGGLSRVFQISDNDPTTRQVVRIENLTLANGSSDPGGCILNDEDLSLVDSVVRDCSSLGSGGGILSSGGKSGADQGARLNLLRTSLIGNVAVRGGALFNEGGVNGQSSGSTAQITDSLFQDNFSDRGGAIFNDGGFFDDTLGATMDILNTTIENNVAQIQGGGIYNDGGRFNNAAGANLVITASNILSNWARTNPADPGDLFPGAAAAGGGIYNDGSWMDASAGAELLLVGTTIDSNHAGEVVTVPPSPAQPDGMIIFNGLGGGIFNDDGGFVASAPGGSITIQDSAISNNFVTKNGGGVISAGILLMERAQVTNNAALTGAGVFVDGRAQLTNVTIAMNVGQNTPGLLVSGVGAELRMAQVTVAGNGTSLSTFGPSFGVVAGTAWVKSSIFDNNVSSSSNNFDECETDLGGVIIGLGYNLATSGQSTLLEECNFLSPTSSTHLTPGTILSAAGLGNNGGLTQTWPILSTGPAKDAIPPSDCTDAAVIPAPVLTDQRGQIRPVGTGCDIGAFEWAPNQPSPVPSSNPYGLGLLVSLILLVAHRRKLIE